MIACFCVSAFDIFINNGVSMKQRRTRGIVNGVANLDYWKAWRVDLQKVACTYILVAVSSMACPSYVVFNHCLAARLRVFPRCVALAADIAARSMAWPRRLVLAAHVRGLARDV